MVAVDVLGVPYHTVKTAIFWFIQDYFTKWAHAIPIHNPTAATITAELVKVFSMFDTYAGHPPP